MRNIGRRRPVLDGTVGKSPAPSIGAPVGVRDLSGQREPAGRAGRGEREPRAAVGLI